MFITCGDKGTGRPQWCFLQRQRGGVNFFFNKGGNYFASDGDLRSDFARQDKN